MRRRWWLWGIGICAVIAVGYWFGFNTHQISSIDQRSIAPSRSNGNGASPILTTDQSSEKTPLAVGIRVPAPRLESISEEVADTSAQVASAVRLSPASRKVAAPISPSKAPTEKPAPLGAGMAARPLVAGGEQKGSALDRVWEAAVRQPVVVNALPASAPDWRVMGAVQRGDATFLLVKFDGQPETRMFALGDKLPGGGAVGWVKPNTLGVVYGKQESLDVPILQGQRDQNRLRLQQAGKARKP
jgi:hypothetical protein